MEPTLGLLGVTTGSGAGPGGGTSGLSTSDPASSSVSKMEKDQMEMSKEGSSYTNEAELELGLGLSLSGNNNGVTKGKGSAAWGEYGRILTAKDFPHGFPSRAKAVSGTKRAAADCVSGPNEVGSPPSNGASQVVGWPPIRAYRMNSLVNQAKIAITEEDKAVGENEKEESSNKKINHGNKKDYVMNEQGHLGFVKVNMDGLPIGRKVDLNAHSCYKSLAKTLENMFFKSASSSDAVCGEKDLAKQPPKLLDGSSEFALTYEDKEGDWMLVGDVPWGMFLSTVKRLRIMKTSEANGLSPRFQERNNRRKGKPI